MSLIMRILANLHARLHQSMAGDYTMFSLDDLASTTSGEAE